MYFNNIIYIIIAVLIIAALINFAFWLLPYALIAFALYWLYKRLFSGRGRGKNNRNEEPFQGNNTNRSSTDNREEPSKKVIDVDYEEVDD